MQWFQQLSLPKVKQTIDMLNGIWHGEVFIALKIFFARWNFSIGFVQPTLFRKPWYPKGGQTRKGKSYVLMLSCFQTTTSSRYCFYWAGWTLVSPLPWTGVLENCCQKHWVCRLSFLGSWELAAKKHHSVHFITHQSFAFY